MSKKIGIITYHRAHNYGALLQAYSMKKYFQNLGYEVEFIDYWPKYRQGMYDLIDIKFISNTRFGLRIKRILKSILTFPKRYIRYNNFQEFIRDKLNISSAINVTDGEDIDTTYDFYIFGSDQIWRHNNFDSFRGFDKVYWGEFAANINSKKISYAASMGVIPELDKKKIDWISNHLNNFDSISVREEQLFDLISTLTEKNIEHVLDPVFLLDKNEFFKIEKKIDTPKKYILVYNLLYSKKTTQEAIKIAKKNSCEIIEIVGTVIYPFKSSENFKQTIGPREFVYLMRNADTIVSSSFHGLVFSILFEKQFYVADMGEKSDRAKSLLRMLKIGNRFLGSNGIELNDINYESVGKLLQKYIENSKSFLQNSLK